MALTKFNANYRLREDLTDSITPKCMVADDSDRSLGDVDPASWLPIQFTKSNYTAGTDAFVISAWKVVALDASVRPNGIVGCVVPAGMRLKLGGTGAAAGAFAGTVLTYTATDVSWGVIDLVTGDRVAAAVSYTGEQVCDALIERGLVCDDDVIVAGGAVPVTTDAHVAVVIDHFISDPIGIVLQDVNVWAGMAENGDQFITNYSKQSGLAYFTRCILRAPLRAAGATTTDAFVTATLNASPTTFAAGTTIDDGELWLPAQFIQLNRYSDVSASAPVRALGLAERHIARATDRTPFLADVAGVLVRERGSVSAISKEGDYFLDADVGVLFLHSSTWATLVAGTTTVNFSYNFYTDTGVAATHRYLHFDGPCRPGQWVSYDTQSNLTAATAAQIAAGKAIGRVSKLYIEPRGLLQYVKTAWNINGASAAMRMPGTATKGFSDMITLSAEDVSDTLVEVAIRF